MLKYWETRGVKWLDNLKLGYGGTKTEMERLISDANKVKEANGEMADLSIDSFADITEAIHIMQEEQKIAGTTAREAGTTIEGSINSMKGAWENLLTGLADPDADIAQLVENLATTIFGDGTDTNKGVVGNVVPAVKMILETIYNLIMESIAELPAMIPELMKKGTEMLNGFIDGISDNLDMILEVAFDIIIALIDGLTENLPSLLDKAVDLIIQFALKLTEPAMLQKLIESTVYLITALVTGILKNLPKLITTVPQIILNIRKALINAIRNIDWGQIGKQLLQGLLDGMLNYGNGIIKVAKKIVNDIKDNIKNFFGIKSPSRVMRDEIGKFIPSGIAVGIEANTGSALKAIDEMNDEIMDKVRGAYELETGKINASASMYNNSTIQINSSLKGASVELDGQKVGRLITPVVSKTLKTVGG